MASSKYESPGFEIRLKSEFKRQPWPGEPKDENENNDRFRVRFFLPPGFNSPSNPGSDKHLLILTNGLGEFSSRMYTGHGGFCQEFRKHGIASVFLPLPYHFRRLSNADQRSLSSKIARGERGIKHPAVEKILRHKERFYIGYEQLWWDIVTLNEQILSLCENGALPIGLKISLWGYSIGGLPILSQFLCNPGAYHACILVHSGANLEHLGHNRLLFTEEQWEDLRSFYKRRDYLKTVPLLGCSLSHMFEDLFVKKRSASVKALMRKHCSKILLFVGAKDDVETQRGIIATIVPEDHGLPIHILPGLRHLIMGRRFQQTWFEYEVQTTIAFLDYHPR